MDISRGEEVVVAAYHSHYVNWENKLVFRILNRAPGKKKKSRSRFPLTRVSCIFSFHPTLRKTKPTNQPNKTNKREFHQTQRAPRKAGRVVKEKSPTPDSNKTKVQALIRKKGYKFSAIR